MTNMFKSIHHVAIICSDYERSRYFYTQILGFQVIAENYREKHNSYKLDLVLNDIRLELFSFEDAPKRASYPENCGLRHLAFAVSDIELTINYLKEHNISCEEIRIDEYTGKRFTFFTDPDNLPLELYEE